MSATVEVFADVTCPFTHVGLKRVVEHVAEIEHRVDVIVRAWPLEWVNEAGLDVDGVLIKADALSGQLGFDDFPGLRADRWPSTTIPAHNLAAVAYERDAAIGLAVSLELRTALFERGLDISDPDVLQQIADAHRLERPSGTDAIPAVRADYEDGLARHVTGSPHFWIDHDDFFCPALDLGHDADGKLTARLDVDGLARFFARLDA